MDPPSWKSQKHSCMSYVQKKSGIKRKKRPPEQKGTRDKEMCVSARLPQRSLNMCARWKRITGWRQRWLVMGKGGPFSSQSGRETHGFRRGRKYRSLLQKYKSSFNKWLKPYEFLKKDSFPAPCVFNSFPAWWNVATAFAFLLYFPVVFGERVSDLCYLTQTGLQKVKNQCQDLH